jgi:hypothetical protein
MEEAALDVPPRSGSGEDLALTAQIRTKSEQFALLSEVAKALQSTLEIAEVLSIILTAVTAGAGLGFNRAFLLVSDDGGRTVRGRMAVGPRDPDEAASIWKEIGQEGRSLGQVLRDGRTAGPDPDSGIMRIASRLCFPVSGASTVVARCLREGTSFACDGSLAEAGTAEIAEVLGNERFLIVPLVAEGQKLGVIIADNFVTGRPIETEDIRFLETLAGHAALALLNAVLHESLRLQLKQLEQAHSELSRNHMQLMRAERLVALSGLAASLSHDLRTPLISIGFIAKSAAAEVKDAEIRARFESIAREISRVEDYLSSFSGSVEGFRKDAVPVDIGRVIDDSLGVVRGLLAGNSIDSTVSLGHGSGKAMGNPLELRQVLISLMHNAIEAMPDGGRLTIETALEGENLRISVADTGVGIPDEAKHAVFSLSYTNKPEGSGLGLFLARSIVGEHGGSIRVDSEEGAGACFSVVLPAVRGLCEAGDPHTP